MHTVGIPDLEDSAIFSRCEETSITGHRKPCNDTFMREARNEQWIDDLCCFGNEVPFANSIVGTGGVNRISVRTKSHGILFGLRLTERVQSLTSRHLPDLNCAVGTGTC